MPSLMPETTYASSDDWGDFQDTAASDAFVWLHVLPGESLTVAILSEKPVTYSGHFIGGTALHPCTRPICARCRSGIGTKKRGVFSVYDFKLGLRGLLELGEIPTRELYALSRDRGALRGLTITLSRLRPGKNSPITFSPAAAFSADVTLPESQDPLICLHAQWARMALAQRVKDGGPSQPGLGHATPPRAGHSTSRANPQPASPAPARAGKISTDANPQPVAVDSACPNEATGWQSQTTRAGLDLMRDALLKAEALRQSRLAK